MDVMNRGRDHTQVLSLSIKENSEQRNKIGVRLTWPVFSWELEILSSSKPHPPLPLPQWNQPRRTTLIFEIGMEGIGEDMRHSKRLSD